MFSNRTRLFLTILAVAWGTFSIAIMLAVGDGLRMTFASAVNNAGEAALIISGHQSTQPYRGQRSGIKVILTQEDLYRLRVAMYESALVTGAKEWDVKIHKGNKTHRGPPLTAVDALYDKVHGVSVLPGGRFINAEDERLRRQVIVLGTKTVPKVFKPRENPVGQMIYLAGKPFLIVGVQRKTLQLVSTNSVPDVFANWVPYSTYQEVTNDRTYDNFIIAPFDLKDVPKLQRIAKYVIASRRQLNPDDPGILNFINLQKEKTKINLFSYGIEIFLGVIGALTLVVAGVGIANVMYISVKRATREIGIRMAIGATTYEILFYYACEALMTTALGGAIGLLMAKGLVLLVNKIPMNSELLDYFGNPRPILSWSVMLIVILVLGVIGFVAGIFPAKKAASINPAEALRYE